MSQATPTVHVNGTDGPTLMRETMVARNLAGQLTRALMEMTVHGRDYYPQGPDAIVQAQREHAKRIQDVQAIERELNAILVALRDQGVPL